MEITPCKYNGLPGFKLEIGSGPTRKRQYFRKESDAEAARSKAEKDQAALGKAWDIMTARQKSDLMHWLKEIKDKGFTRESLLQIAQTGNAAPVKPSLPLRRAIDETLASKRKLNLRGKYLDGLELYLNAFAKGREEMPVSQFGPEQIEAWFNDREEAPTTRNSNLGRLSSLFGYCWRKGYIAANPCKMVEKAKVDETTPETLPRRKCVKALVWCLRKKPEFLAWLTLALFVGLRPVAEADNVDWDKIDLKKGTIRIEGDSTKVRRTRLIQLSLCPPALEWLRLAKASGCKLDISYSTRRRYMRSLRDFLGFKNWPQDVLRHTAATNLLAVHQDAGKVAKFLGNSPGTLLKDYADQLLEKEEAEKFMRLLPPWRHKIAAGLYRIT